MLTGFMYVFSNKATRPSSVPTATLKLSAIVQKPISITCMFTFFKVLYWNIFYSYALVRLQVGLEITK
jgi:hypothetical protein